MSQNYSKITNHTIWHSRPLFITSTFRDMQAERDWLCDRLFLELEELLRAPRTHLEPIDLRWGVETVSDKEEMVKELLALKVFLAEVEGSRPFRKQGVIIDDWLSVIRKFLRVRQYLPHPDPLRLIPC